MTTTNPSTIDWANVLIENVAEVIYDQMSYTESGEKPRWVPYGNSLKQDEARKLARKATKELDSLLSRKEEEVRKEVVEFIREQMPVICYSYSTEEMETLFEAATNPTH